MRVARSLWTRPFSRLREKVAAKPPDEGVARPSGSAQPKGAALPLTPTLSRNRERGRAEDLRDPAGSRERGRAEGFPA